MARLHIDFETRSTCDLRRTNARRYADDMSTQVLMLCYALDDGPVKWWLPLEEGPPPSDLIDYMTREDVTLVAHNAQFEMSIFTGYHMQTFPEIREIDFSPERWDDTAAKAARQGLPRALGQVSQVLDLPIKKDDEGRRLMLKMCKPAGWSKDGRAKWHETPEQMKRLLAYCVDDVETERLVDWALD